MLPSPYSGSSYFVTMLEGAEPDRCGRPLITVYFKVRASAGLTGFPKSRVGDAIMKFKDLDDSQKAGVIQIYTTAFSKKMDAAHDLFKSLLHLLIYGNAGCAVAALTLVGIQIQRSGKIPGLILPLVFFGVGILLCGLVYAGHVAVTEQAVDHWERTIKSLIQNQISLEDVKGWGWSPTPRKIAFVMLLGSLACLLTGIITGLSAIDTL